VCALMLQSATYLSQDNRNVDNTRTFLTRSYCIGMVMAGFFLSLLLFHSFYGDILIPIQ
jgi:hypothetical protein